MAREVKLSLRSLRSALDKGIKRGQKLVTVAQSGIQAVRKIRNETKHSKAELRALADQQRAAKKNQDLLASAKDAFARKADRDQLAAANEAKRGRAAARAVQNAAYKDSRINLQGIYATVGNLREKVPTLARSLSDPAAGFSTLVSVFGEGIAGVTAAAPFMAAAGGMLALVKPILEEWDREQKQRLEEFVKTEIARALESDLVQRFEDDKRFALNETNRAIEVYEKQRQDLAKGGWVNRDDVEFEGF